MLAAACSIQANVLIVILEVLEGLGCESRGGEVQGEDDPSGHSSRMADVSFPCPSPVAQKLVVGARWLGECWGSSQLEHPCGKRQATGED